jgi:hypothetical protein
VRAVRPAGEGTTPGGGAGSIWGDGASVRSAGQGSGAYGALRYGRASAQVASHSAGVERHRSDAERPNAGRLKKSEGVVGKAYQELRGCGRRPGGLHR